MTLYIPTTSGGQRTGVPCRDLLAAQAQVHALRVQWPYLEWVIRVRPATEAEAKAIQERNK